jgi:DNA repair protein RadA/Sms
MDECKPLVGGLKLEDPSTDVAVALAIASSFVERALPADMAFFGEVGLGAGAFTGPLFSST